jgi:hypothetical protein
LFARCSSSFAIRGDIVYTPETQTAVKDTVKEAYAWIMDEKPFSFPSGDGFNERLVRFCEGGVNNYCLIGISPREIVDDDTRNWSNYSYATKDYDNCGWYIGNDNGKLYSQDGDNHKAYLGKPIKPGTLVSVRLHKDRSVSFAINGKDKGKAFQVPDIGKELFLTVGMYGKGTKVGFEQII